MPTKEELFTVLKDWNLWYHDIDKGKERIVYVTELLNLVKTGEVLIINGVRRSGKSTVLRQVLYHLLDSGVDKKNTLFVNLEDPRFVVEEGALLLERIFETYKEFMNPVGKIYVVLDEVQVLSGWEKWVRTKHELGEAVIFVTGSTSKLLSREFGMALSGRYLEMKMYPLSFQEFLGFKAIPYHEKKDMLVFGNEIKRVLREYAQFGGFPKVFFLDKEEHKERELQAYFESIILKDIVARHGLKNYENIKKLMIYILTNVSSLHTGNKLRDAVGLPYDTCAAYVEYLKEAFLLFEVFDYSYSLKEQYKKPKKMYGIDLGIRNSISFRFLEDKGRIYENLVFLELKRRKKDVYFFGGKNECDFVIKEGLKIKECFQVTVRLTESNKKREINGLLEAMEKFHIQKGTIITDDEEWTKKINGKIVTVIPLWKWLLIP